MNSNNFYLRLRNTVASMPTGAVLVLILFVINLLFASSHILPAYDEINPFDGAKYIESGRQLVDGGELREISRSPTLSIIYAVIYLFVQNSLDWFVLSAGIGNLILYTLLWFATFYFGLRFKDHFSPFILVGVIFVSPVPINILANPSDALLAVFSAVALAKTIDFMHSQRLRDVGWASLFMGLVFVTRLDGLYLLPLFALISVLIGFRRQKLVQLIAAVLAPAVLTIGIFHVVSGITRGNFNANFGGIAYASLQWYGKTDASGTLIGGEEVAETFGTPEETGGSAIGAFARNPSAVLSKIEENLRKLPDQILSDYGGKKFSPFFLLFAAFGTYALLRKKHYLWLALFVLWSMNVLMYLPYYTRSGYYLHFFFILFTLCAIGLRFTFSNEPTQYERSGTLLLLIALLFYSMLDQKPAFVAVAVLTLGALLSYWLIQNNEPAPRLAEMTGLFLALCSGLLLRSAYSFPQPWVVGESPGEQAVHYLETHLERGEVVGTYVPKPVVAARMTETQLYGVPIGEDPVGDIQAWIESKNVSAFIVEPNFINSYPDIWNAIKSSTGTLVELARIFDPGSIQVFMVKD